MPLDHSLDLEVLQHLIAAHVITTGRCEECRCTLHEPKDPECGDCPCHCECCCPPMFACLTECTCKCECHYTVDDSDSIVGETPESAGEQEEEDTATEHREPAGGQTRPTAVGNATANGKQEETGQHAQPPPDAQNASQLSGGDVDMDGTKADTESEAEDENMESGDEEEEGRGEGATTKDERSGNDETGKKDGEKDMAGADSSGGEEDVVMTQERLPDTATPAQIFAAIVNERITTTTTDDSRYARLLGMLFKHAFAEAVQPSQPRKAGSKLPELEEEELKALQDLLDVLLDERKYSLPRVLGQLKDVSKAAVRSSWSLIKILRDRTAAAKAPEVPPANVWTRSQSSQTASASIPAQCYDFDPQAFSPDEVTKLTTICEQAHVFAETTRAPTPDEWVVIVGMMNGTILAKALPQFLKRCCTMIQLAWIHRQIVLKAEGELWAPPPPLSKMYDYNQSSKRLIAELLSGAAHRGWQDQRLHAMLSEVKVATYNHAMYSLHFHFFTKGAAVKWTGLEIPFRASKLILRNPDAVAEERSASGTPESSMSRDNLVNDRYQAHYKLSDSRTSLARSTSNTSPPISKPSRMMA